MSHCRALIVAGLMTLGPHVAIAQPPSTAEGIAAFVRGDYARAVEILKPAAERWHLPHDNIAAFFMAMMYENGLGIAPIRCVHARCCFARQSPSGMDHGRVVP